MKRGPALRIALAISVLFFLTFCDLNFNLSFPDPSLDVTVQTVYFSTTDVSIQFSFVAEEDKHLFEYTLAKNGGTAFSVVLEGREQLLSGQVYTRTYDVSSYGTDGTGHYRFSFSVLLERNGSYESPPFLQDTVDFWVDPTAPSDPVTISVPSGSYNSALEVELDHQDLDTINGSPARIFYTRDESVPDSSSTLYVPGNPITIATSCTLKAVAIDLADRKSDFNSATYIIDSIPPIAPDTPTSAEAPDINEDEELAGFDVTVGLGTSGAETGDELELLLDGSSFPSPLIGVLAAEDVAAGFYTFTVGPGQLGSDGTKQLTARVTDMAGNAGADSDVLTLILDTMDPPPPGVDPDSGTYSTNEVTLSHLDWPTSISGNPVRLYYTINGTTSEYTGTPITLSDGTTDIRAVAIDKAGNTSSELTASYVIDTIAPANPSMDHSSGDYSSAFDLVLSHPEIPDTSGTEVQVYYTIGSIASPPPNPDSGSILYAASIPIDRNTITKAIAIDEAGNSSSIVSRTFTFLRIDSIFPSSCSQSESINTVDIGGFFFDKQATNVGIYISDGVTQQQCYLDEGVSSYSSLHVIILDTYIAGMSTGPGTLTVVNLNNGDSVSAPITIDP